MPGVLIVEALAQAAGVLAVESLGLAGSGKLVYFMAIDGAKFRAPVEPGVLLRLEVEFVQKRATVCKFAGKAYVGEQARRAGRFHGDDRRSAEGLSAGVQPCPPTRDAEHLGELRRRPVLRDDPAAIHDENAIGIALGRVEIVDRDQRGAVASRDISARISSITRIRHSGSRLAVGSSSSSSFGRGASARASITRPRSPVESVSIRRSSSGSSSSSGGAPSPPPSAIRSRASSGQAASRAGREEGHQPQAGVRGPRDAGRRRPAPLVPVRRRSRPARGAGWSCRCHWGRPGRPARPPRSSSDASNRRCGSERPEARSISRAPASAYARPARGRRARRARP